MNRHISPEAAALLTEVERERLTFWRWTYQIQSDIGLTWPEARRLAFLLYLRMTGRLENETTR